MVRVVLLTIWCGLFPVVLLAQSVNPVIRRATGTGRIYGEVARVLIRNESNESVETTIPACIIPATDRFQPYLIPFDTQIQLNAGEEKEVGLYGYCLDPYTRAVPKGKPMVPSTEWIFGPMAWTAPTVETSGGSGNWPCVDRLLSPGVSSILSPEQVPMLLACGVRLHDYAAVMSPLPDGIPLAEMVQQAIWQLVTSFTDHPWDYSLAAVSWWQLPGVTSDMTNTLDFVTGTGMIWHGSEVLLSESICQAGSEPSPDGHSLTAERLQVFGVVSPTPEDRTTAPRPPVPPVPPPPPLPPPKSCSPQVELLAEPAMDGGLSERSVGTFLLKHAVPLALVAEGADADKIRFRCEPGKECPETPSVREEGLTSRVKFRWEHIEGPGHFIIGRSDTSRISTEKVVLWQPPDLFGTVTAGDTATFTKLRLTILDDLPGQPQDEPVVRFVGITCTRDSTMRFDSLKIEVDGIIFTRYIQPEPQHTPGTCDAQPLEWSQKEDLRLPLAMNVTGIVQPEEKIILRAHDKRDPDKLNLHCSTSCDSEPLALDFEDEVIYQWQLLGSMKDDGYFMKGEGIVGAMAWGKEVIYRAPRMTKDDLRREVLIEVRAYNPPGRNYEFERTPHLRKAIDTVVIDTLLVVVDCDPGRRRPTAMVVIGWRDEFKDHDHPWVVETLRDVSSVVTLTIPPDECVPTLKDEHLGEPAALNATLVKPRVHDFNPQTDDEYSGQIFCFQVGTFWMLFDIGIIIDDGFISLPSDKEVKEFIQFKEDILEALTAASLFPRMAGFAFGDRYQPELFRELGDFMLTLIGTGDIPDSDPFFQRMVDDYLSRHPGVSREEAMNILRNDIPRYGNGWQNHPIVKKYEIGLIYSWWTIISHPANCMDNCPLVADHFTWSSLGDTDHYYKRTSSISTVTYPNNHPHHHTYSFSHENKGADFD